ncbi:D-ribitol-5-phosphate cytidylyltransferase isoform X2 [Halyomorpha halys]|uniref:D-ribitol-5-phosphate cytidylyltransferase isoform X2 n=1 Tax=Halyomorpha halys TaxID=286706 RepID=UPI000D0C8C14|nr:D-ribitol-5-phosphate cytidylyltransferase-like isoform X2 [Halyomorpha halys]
MVEFDVGVVMPCAGSSERMGGSIPKQYIKIMGRPLFLYAVEEFRSLKYVKKISLVVDNVEHVLNILQEYGLSECPKILLTAGSSSRHRSIKAGLQELQRVCKDSEIKVVIVHDGVRPFVCVDLLTDLIKAASTVGAAGFVRPLVSTVLSTNQESTMEKALIRNQHVASETPQAFQFSLLISAYNKCSDEEIDNGTECLQLVLSHCGINAKLISGKEELFKVTHKKDLYLAEGLLREKTTDVCIITDEENEAVRLLSDSLHGKVGSLEVVVGDPSSKNLDKTYNIVILFHSREIQQDLHLLDFASLIDLDKQGLIIHVIEHGSVEGLQGVSVYNLHRNSRKMAHNYEKLRKGVVIVHSVSSNENQRLVDILTTVVTSGYQIFSGQTLFI